MTELTPREISKIFQIAREKDKRPNFKGIDLSYIDLNRTSLNAADFNEVNLSGANLIEANLDYSDLSRANLIQADLIGAHLVGANLSGADLSGANLIGANLVEANLSSARLTQTDLSGANLTAAQFSGANLDRADLIGANLMGANLSQADLSGANLSGANLIGVNLVEANLSGARLIEADLGEATLGYTNLIDIDLSQTHGLELATHRAPSALDIRSLYRSKGFIPEPFLIGIGAPDELLKYVASLNDKPPVYFSCFVSYADQDAVLAQQLLQDLQRHGARCWDMAEALKFSDSFRPTFDSSIRVQDKLLLIFSEHSLTTDWIAQEVEAALQRESELDEIVLFPIRLDETMLALKAGWIEPLQNNRNIHNFVDWQDKAGYQKSFERLLRHLKARHK